MIAVEVAGERYLTARRRQSVLQHCPNFEEGKTTIEAIVSDTGAVIAIEEGYLIPNCTR